jgi:hypothetical protein
VTQSKHRGQGLGGGGVDPAYNINEGKDSYAAGAGKKGGQGIRLTASSACGSSEVSQPYGMVGIFTSNVLY